MRAHRFGLPAGFFAVGLFLAACGGEGEDTTTTTDDSITAIQSALALENGGYTMDDELPGFGLADLDQDDVIMDSSEPVPLPPDPGAISGQEPLPPPENRPCPHGMLKGVWKELAPELGVIRGKWASSNRKVVGHLKGIYGKNQKGQGVFFAKYIDVQGKAAGLIKGTFGEGAFRGRWFDRNGLQGMLEGLYAKHHFLGLWMAFCDRCPTQCKPGFVPAPDNKCICVPERLIPCKIGHCPAGMTCDPCPPICAAEENCPAVCGPPVCVPLPPPPPPAPGVE